MIEILILGGIALAALLWPRRGVKTNGEIIVRLYLGPVRVLETTAKCTIRCFKHEALITDAVADNLERTVDANRITVSLPMFSDFETELSGVEKFRVYKNSSLTLQPKDDQQYLVKIS